MQKQKLIFQPLRRPPYNGKFLLPHDSCIKNPLYGYGLGKRLGIMDTSRFSLLHNNYWPLQEKVLGY